MMWLFSSRCSRLLPVPALMHWAHSCGTGIPECGFQPLVLLSEDAEEVKEELLHVESCLVSSHTKISVNVKKAFKNIKRYCQSSMTRLSSSNELFLFGIFAGNLTILTECHVF